MKTYQKVRFFSGLNVATAYLATTVIIRVVLNYPAITDPLDNAALVMCQ
jgi:hypothetical protein